MQVNDTGAGPLSHGQWRKIVLPAQPQPRHSHGCSVLTSPVPRLFFFGGSGENNTEFDELVSFDISTFHWTVKKPHAGAVAAGEWPCSRYGCSCCSLGGSLYIFGGRSSHGGFLNDTWRYDAFSSSWLRLHYENVAPPPRMYLLQTLLLN